MKLDIGDNDVLDYFQCFFKEIKYSASIEMLSLRVATFLLLLFSTGRMSPRNLLIQTEDEGSNVEERKEGQSQGSDYFGGKECEPKYVKPSLDECERRCAGAGHLGGAHVCQTCDCSYPDYSYCDCPKSSIRHGNYF